MAYDIDPKILQNLPEDILFELLSVIEWQPPQNQGQVPNQAPTNEPVAANNAQPVVLNEEVKDDLGIDQEFLANLPEDLRQEML